MASTFTWQIAAGQTLTLTPGTTTIIATGANGMTATVTPALPTGRTLSVTTDGLLVIVAAASAPAVDQQGPWVIDVTG